MMTQPVEKSTIASWQESLQAFAGKFDDRLADFLKPCSNIPEELIEAVRYSVLAPGKRIRPFLVVRCCELAGGQFDSAWAAAAAIECVHAFSLIHDDLPAMDDDNLRRGRLSCHKKFSEAVAILAGDALVVLAFELIAKQINDPALSTRLILELAEASGWSGMIGGQMADVLSESQSPSLDLVRYIHDRKTATLFTVACRFGVLIGSGDADMVDALGRYGQRLGQLFQMADDLLDVTASSADLGKPVEKDDRAGKQTYLRCVGIEKSRSAIRQALQETIQLLQRFGSEADDLRELARFVADRNY